MTKKIRLYKFLYLFIVVISLSACEDMIDVELRSAEPRIVIEGNVRMDSLATIRITMTKDFSSTNEYLPVKDAIVKLWDDFGNKEILQLNDSGYYVSISIRGVEKRVYNLSVEHEGTLYTAVSQMPPVVKIDSLTLFEFPMIDYPTPMVHFAEPKGIENDYYRAIVYVNGKLPGTGYGLINGDYMDGLVIHERLSVSTDNSNDDEDPVKQGDELMVELQCIDEGAYKFWETLMMIGTSLNNPTSNIKGGALGYFNAYSFDRMTITAIW